MRSLNTPISISIICSSPDHPVNRYLEAWAEQLSPEVKVRIVRRQSDLESGELLFLVSCTEKISAETRSHFKHSLVLHASDLPQGRGWSPHIWTLLAGANALTVTLLEASDEIDRGSIWRKEIVEIPPHYLWDEINHAIFNAELALMTWALNNFSNVQPIAQRLDEPTSYFRKRSPQDSQIDPSYPLADLFNQIRLSDPNRYPAFFDLHGLRYSIRIEKVPPKDVN